VAGSDSVVLLELAEEALDEVPRFRDIVDRCVSPTEIAAVFVNATIHRNRSRRSTVADQLPMRLGQPARRRQDLCAALDIATATVRQECLRAGRRRSNLASVRAIWNNRGG
jgi:hypothetical protein